MGLKDAWYADCGPSAEDGGRKTFVVVYHYKNLGPREEREPLAWGDVRKEIKTDKGHVFPGKSLPHFQQDLPLFPGHSLPPALFARLETNRGVFWWEKKARKIEETGELALAFAIPKDEVPTEVIAGGRIDLDLKLPQWQFGYRRWSPFGFLPQRLDMAVPALTQALQYEDKNFNGSGRVLDYSMKHPFRQVALSTLATMGPVAKDAVPTIINVLLNDESRRTREAAAKTLARLVLRPRKRYPH